ncbi:hypothetical protein NPIL_335291 [Nephila pilipes]|uniref:Uncharacterized protein n=1 Tax=Nephila pilipes TaxID=299642 RepID=A0A8X6NBZ4_NEPPI|nr:hypothetical protein NPIL_335291 [Nephila pilipes]
MEETRKNEADTDVDVPSMMLKYGIREKLKITVSSVGDLLYAVDKYQLKGRTQCSDYLKSTISIETLGILSLEIYLTPT